MSETDPTDQTGDTTYGHDQDAEAPGTNPGTAPTDGTPATDGAADDASDHDQDADPSGNAPAS